MRKDRAHLQARSLRFVDLSDTTWDKKGIDYLVQALNCVRVRSPPVPEKEPIAREGEPEGDNGKEHASEQAIEDTSRPVDKAAPSALKSDDSTVIEEESTAYGSFMPPAPLLKEVEDEARPAAVQSLRMDGCALRANVMEALGE